MQQKSCYYRLIANGNKMHSKFLPLGKTYIIDFDSAALVRSGITSVEEISIDYKNN